MINLAEVMQRDTTMQEYSVAIGQNGRIVIPTAMRKALNLQKGQRLLLRIQNDAIVMEKAADVINKLQQRFKTIPVSLANELIAERRLEAKKD